MTTHIPPRNPEPGKPTYARLLTGQTIYHATYDAIVEIPPGTRLTVIAVVDQSKHQQFYGRYNGGSIPSMVICPLSEVEHAEPETESERQTRGIAAVQFLQSLAGLRLDDTEALLGWNQMDAQEQRYTLGLAERIRFQKTKRMELLAAELKTLGQQNG